MNEVGNVERTGAVVATEELTVVSDAGGTSLRVALLTMRNGDRLVAVQVTSGKGLRCSARLGMKNAARVRDALDAGIDAIRGVK